FYFFGPHAVAAFDRSGEISILVSHPWDEETLRGSAIPNVQWDGDFKRGLATLRSKFKGAKFATAGMELMEAHFVDAQDVSATSVIEALRRVKTSEEIEILRAASRLAD